MKFKDLTDEQIEESRKIYWNRELKWDERMKILMKKFNKSERTVRKWCVKLGFKENTFDNDSEQYKIAQKRVFDKTKDYYLITWAQNNTPVHERFFDNLKAYAEFLNADLHVIAGRYRNPTSVFSDAKHDVWDKKVAPYLDATRNEINNHVTILSDVKIQPTAVNPMTGMQGFSVKTSCIFGSPKVQLQSIPVIHKNEPRVMMTTGACTKKNYTDSKAGKKGEFHHTYGAVIVEVKDLDKVFVRQITAKDDGDFNDLYFNVSNGVIRRNEYIEAIIYGDIHAGEHDQSLLDETKSKILDKLKPKNVILHDVFSGLSINPHEAKDVFLQYGKQLNGHDDLKKELDILIDVLAQFKDQEKVVIVRSNHDVFLDRWLKNEDWKKQPSLKNSRLYMRLSDMLLKQYEDNPYKVKGVIPEIINDVFPEYITLGLTDSYKVKGFELGMHGHIGINGARPGVESFRKLNTKIVSAHTHSAFRKDGLVVCGTSTKLKLNYNHGPSSWTQGHTIIDNYGKAQSIIFLMVSSQRSNDISNNRYNYKNMNSAEKVFSLELRKILTYIDTELLDEYTTKTITPTFFVFSLLNNKKCNAYKALSILSTSGRLDDVYNIFSMLMNEYIKITIPKKLRKRKKDDTNKITYNNELSKYLFDAESERDFLNNKFVGSEHVLLAMLKDEESELSKIFSKININYEVFKGVFKNEKLEVGGDLKNESIPTNSNDKRRGDNRKTTGKKGALDEYCTNLNDEAKNGKIDMLIGRENEVNRIIKVMSRRNKNNVVLVGLPGVGKTAIARGLTNLIEDRRASFLNDKVIMLLRTTALVAGTSYRGMLEDRMDNIIKELKENKDYILLIDDIHTIMGNTSGSSGELSGIIANAMSDDDLQIIATTSFKGYKSIETNATLSRRFQKIVVEPTTIKETEDILFNIKKYYEKHHNVEYTNGSIKNCVKLANKYINERQLPDSAIDVMDECGSDKRVYNESDNNLLELKKDLEMTEHLRDSAMKRNNVAAGDIHNQESKRIKGKIIDLEKEMRENKKHTITKVNEGDVYKVVSEMVNIPITKLNVDEKKKFLDIENILNSNIIGQEDAIKKVSQVIKRNRVGFDRKNKPTGAFLLIGTSGVGKTLLAKKLAEEIYGGENFLVRFDMSEYSDKTSVNKLIGTGAGYVGFDQGGLLTEMIKNKKHCVLLLDEIEKADPEVINLLLQVLDEASLTDNTGQKISFKNVIILMTSNIGAKKADMFAKGTGFMNNEEENKKTISEKELKKFFPPEFLNRLDSTVYFNELNDEDLKSIIELELNNLNGKFKEMGLSFEYTKPVRDYLFNIVVKERNFGARPINRAIQNEIENKIADIYLEDDIEDGYVFKISVSKGEIVIK